MRQHPFVIHRPFAPVEFGGYAHITVAREFQSNLFHRIAQISIYDDSRFVVERAARQAQRGT